jgi:signal transduction histidine kinase
MRSRGLIPLLALCLHTCTYVPGEDFSSLDHASPVPFSGTLTNIIQCLEHARSHPGGAVPLRVEADITFVDRERNFVVLQDYTEAMAVFMPSIGLELKSGQHVTVKGSGVFPCVRAFPTYPDRPSKREILPSFETPPGLGTYYLARIRGYLRPPATGKYTFWIAADDEGEFYLSPDASPEKMQRLATNRIGNATAPHEWDRYPSQRSQSILLKAGEVYYVEARHVQNFGNDCLAVAWEGPGITRSVIDRPYLTPWIDPSSENGPTNGLLRECWTNFFLNDYDSLRPENPKESFVRIHSLDITVVGDGEKPVPIGLTPEEGLDDIPDLHWVEVEGEVLFAAGTKEKCRLELKRGDSVLNAIISNWSGLPIERLIHSRVRIQGVLVHAYGSGSTPADALLWVPDSQQVNLSVFEDNQSENLNEVPICEIEPSNNLMSWGRQVSVRGRIVDRTTNGLLVVESANNYQGFYSTDGTNWAPLGKPVEINISNSALAGLAVASQSSTDLVSASFGGLQLWGTNWSSADIGNPGRPGQFELHDGIASLNGSGAQIGLNRDQQYYAYQPLEDRTEVAGRLVDLQQLNSRTQAGIMIRESLDRRAAYVAVLFTPIGGAAIQYRRTLGNYSESLQAGATYHRYGWMKLVKRTSSLLVQGEPGSGILTNDEVKISGVIHWNNGTPFLAEAFFQAASQNLSSPQLVIKQTLRGISISDFVAKAQHPPETYMSRNIRALNVRGVVTFCGDVLDTSFFFIQDGNGGGIQVAWPNTDERPQLEVGQSLEMSGQSPVRRFPVVFEPLRLKVTGWGTLPEAAQYSSALLKSDGAQARWVEAVGVVRSVETNGFLNLMTSEGLLPVWIGQKETMRRQYVDSSLRLRGVLSMDSAHSVRLLVPSAEFVEMQETPPADPFIIPTVPISQLAALDVRPEHLRKMKLSGVVTCRLPQGVFVQDETGGAFLQTSEAVAIHRGDRVEAVGFPGSDSAAVTLGEVEIRKISTASLPDPIRLVRDDLDEKKHAGLLVSLKAKLIDQHNTWGGQVLFLQAGTKIFEAMLMDENSGRLPDLAIGSRLAITGVCQVGRQNTPASTALADPAASPAMLRLWLHSSTDVTVLERPPWWTLKRAAWTGVLFAIGLFGALVWVRILRRRVALRTVQLKAAMSKLEKETRTSAVLAERDRLAGEIHDSLEQGLTAIMLQLDTANKHTDQSPEARKFLRMARNMAEFSRSEVQHAVWDMQSPLLANADLGTALKHVVGQISSGPPEVNVEIAGPLRPLPSSQEHHLLRIAQEAITNAIKHAEARSIQVTLNYAGPDLVLTIQDDGKGFVPSDLKSQRQNGHFGLQGIQARAKKIEAQLDITSRIGVGTVITVQMKLNGTTKDASATKTEP